MNRRGAIAVTIIFTTLLCLMIAVGDKCEAEKSLREPTPVENKEDEVLGVEYTTEEYRKELQDVTTLSCIESQPFYRTFEEIPLDRFFQVEVQKLCSKYEVDYALILAVMDQETGGTFNTKVDRSRSHVGAMQISTYWFKKKAAELGLDIYSEMESIELGISYMRDLLEKYDGEPALAVMAYNAGEDKANTLFKQGTINKYTQSVMALRDKYDVIVNWED